MCALAMMRCCPECEVIDDPNFIGTAIRDGDIVTVWDDSVVYINGIIVGTLRKGLTVGCFGIPECISMTEPNRGIIKKLNDDFSLYSDLEDMGGSTTYFSSESYGPYWVGNGNGIAFRNIVDNHGGGAYQPKRQGCCANNPDKCHCYE